MFDVRWRSTKVLAGYGVAVALLWLFLRNAEWPVIVDGLRSVGWRLLAAAIVVRLASLVVSSWRWRMLLAPVRRVPFAPVVATMMMGMTVSAIVSMQAAEVARPYLLSRRTDVDFSAAVATVAVEWVLDWLAVLALFIPVSGLVATGATPQRADLNLALALFVAGALAALALLRWMPRSLGAAQRWIQTSRLVPGALRAGLTRHVGQFAIGLRILERPAGLVGVGACSLLTAALAAVSAWLTLRAFGLPVSFLSGFVILGLITVGGMIPTPGAVGGFHAICQFGLVAWFGLDAARTVAPVIGLHAVLYVPAAAVGALCFFFARPSRLESPA